VRYDRALTQRELRATVTLQDEIDLSEMEEEEAGQGPDCEGRGSSSAAPFVVRTYVCRCGDVYALRPGDYEPRELEAVVVPCCSCSNHILVRLPRPPANGNSDGSGSGSGGSGGDWGGAAPPVGPAAGEAAAVRAAQG
jgi:hypothetical protein